MRPCGFQKKHGACPVLCGRHTTCVPSPMFSRNCRTRGLCALKTHDAQPVCFGRNSLSHGGTSLNKICVFARVEFGSNRKYRRRLFLHDETHGILCLGPIRCDKARGAHSPRARKRVQNQLRGDLRATDFHWAVAHRRDRSIVNREMNCVKRKGSHVFCHRKWSPVVLFPTFCRTKSCGIFITIHMSTIFIGCEGVCACVAEKFEVWI